MGLKGKADMITSVLWKDRYGFAQNSELEENQSLQEAGQEAVTAFHEFCSGRDACLEQSSGSEV